MASLLRFLKHRICIALPFFMIGTAGLFAQNGTTVTGIVTDADGIPVVGANVIIKGTATGVTSDFDGNYSIDASADDVLVFSYVGFREQENPCGHADLDQCSACRRCRSA